MRIRLAVIGLVVVVVGAAALWFVAQLKKQPDLTFTDVTIDYAAGAVSWTVLNTDSKRANLAGSEDGPGDNVVIQAYLSDRSGADLPNRSGGDHAGRNSADPDTGAVAVGRARIADSHARLEAFHELTGRLVLKQPELLREYDYLKLIVDAEGALEESNETNNVMVIPIDPHPLPDLKVTRVDLDYKNATFRWTVENVGSAPADLDGDPADPEDNLGIQAFLSDSLSITGSVHGAGSAVIGESPLGLLQPGETRSGERSLPGEDLCDYKYLLVYVAYYSPDESNLVNNTAEVPIRCP